MATVIVSMETSYCSRGLCSAHSLLYTQFRVCKGQFNVFSRYFLFESVFFNEVLWCLKEFALKVEVSGIFLILDSLFNK